MKLADIFQDNMVIQAEKPVRFFGRGQGTATVLLRGIQYRATFADDMWTWELPAQPHGGPHEIAFTLNGRRVTLQNVCFGDVFLCAGQSNMAFTIGEEDGECEVVDDEKIRCCFRTACGTSWAVCREGEVYNWTALGLHVAEEYRRKKDVYVGIVVCAKGASVIRSWIPSDALDDEVFVPLELRHTDNIENPDWNGDQYLFDNNFLPIVPFRFAHVIWYQGESDTTTHVGRVYTGLLLRLINSWRRALRDELPFCVIEICDFDVRQDEGWWMIQRCQREIVNVARAANVVSSKDVCEHGQIHPSSKRALAKKVVKSILNGVDLLY